MKQILQSVLLCLLSVLAGCNWLYDNKDGLRSSAVVIDLDKIKERGNLVVITGYNPLSYFIYKGKPMGYNYELLRAFAEDIGVELELYVTHNPDSMYYSLNRGGGDIIALGQTATKEGRKRAIFTQPYMEVHQVLVQLKPEGWRKMQYDEMENSLIRELPELAGMQVHVRAGTAQFERILDIAEEIGYEIDVVPMTGDITTDDLIRMVAEGNIAYTIADENVALLNSTYYPDIDVLTAVSEPQGLAWAVRKNSPHLLKALNDWLTKKRKSEEYNLIYKKYFKSKKNITSWGTSEFSSVSGGGISKYDNLIRRHARRIGWDWRLLAALIYEESQFDPTACSWAGAEGLMQLMTVTGLRFGAVDLANPDQNIHAGTSYLKHLESSWKEISDSTERVKFILASYNAGESHVRDAMRLAEKYNANPYRWESVAEYLIKKSKPEFYNDPVAQSGYCRGESVVNYVKEVLYQYSHYLKMIEE